VKTNPTEEADFAVIRDIEDAKYAQQLKEAGIMNTGGDDNEIPWWLVLSVAVLLLYLGGCIAKVVSL